MTRFSGPEPRKPSDDRPGRNYLAEWEGRTPAARAADVQTARSRDWDDPAGLTLPRHDTDSYGPFLAVWAAAIAASVCTLIGAAWLAVWAWRHPAGTWQVTFFGTGLVGVGLFSHWVNRIDRGRGR